MSEDVKEIVNMLNNTNPENDYDDDNDVSLIKIIQY